MYHKFGIDKYPTTSVTIDQFNSHIVEFTKEKYSVKSLEHIVDTIINDGNLPENTIGISIDDADKSFYEVGWPIFKKNNMPVTLFVNTSTIHKNNKNYFNLSKKGDLNEAAANLYKTMRKIKKKGFKKIFVSKIPNRGPGLAINDRLKRASN